MIVYFSSAQYEYPADPEVVVPDAAVMISFINNCKRVHPRSAQLMKHRSLRKYNEDVLRRRGSGVHSKTRKGRQTG